MVVFILAGCFAAPFLPWSSFTVWERLVSLSRAGSVRFVGFHGGRAAQIVMFFLVAEWVGHLD